ncbi:SLC13 family permease [Ilumatobacter coccineus]|jgi:di/tricarboxylate transporter|uniref:Putative sulfur deprivation response regulator n=1 Tax=Ilumatobacter coccineus (strain NBRC 103263 / KCTC 29153 / YM16-304) TaxID=1313172 RepID=A0A6C7EB34_ILUCY|nr:SLC13 family permease [Ilumatobacter coccineus]BAN03600.1 putative sulfur deprivation response regulator [Ilumatobacter coccineus YM16-304]
MSADAWITLVAMIVTVGVLLLDRYPPVFVLGGAVGALMFADVIDTDIALSGLSSPAPATIAALYVLAGAVTATGTFANVVDRLLERKNPVVALAAATASISSVVPNTPLVAMFAPRVVRWSQRHGANASRFLLPLSFASILGGVVTLIGTSTNLVVSDLLEQSGAEPLHVLEITAVGLPVAVIGIALLATVGQRLLPERVAAVDSIDRRGREFQVAARVVSGGPLVGRTIADSGLRNLDGVFLALVERGGSAGGISGSATDDDAAGDSPTALAASPHTVLLAGDVCCFVGEVGRVVDLHAFDGLEPLEEQHVASAQGAGTMMFEAVIAPASELVGATLKSVAFRGRYGGAVMAIHRADGDLGGQLGRRVLKAGDVLLVLADESFARRWRNHADFSLVAAVDESPPERRSHSLLVVAATIGLIVVATAGVLSLFEAAVAAAIVVVAGRAISVSEAWRAINLNVTLTMAVAISLGGAVSSSGLAAEVASLVANADSLGLGDVGLVVVTMLATLVLTELLTNTAAAALMVPVALSVAADVGGDPRMLAIAVLIGASCSFLSPVGYQTNLMVYGLGGYRFTDFTRVGLPLTLSTLVTSAIILPIAYT